MNSCQEDNELQNTTEVVISIEAPNNIVSLQDTGKMYDEYGENRASFLEKNLTQKSTSNDYLATRRVHINYNDLKNYMAFIEQESLKANVNIESLGLYFSKYPDDGKMPSGKSVTGREGTENLFINPLTSFPESNTPTSYYIQTNTDGTIEAVPVGYLLNEDASQKTSSNDGATLQSLAANDFPWMPPPSTGSDDIDF